MFGIQRYWQRARNTNAGLERIDLEYVSKLVVSEGYNGGIVSSVSISNAHAVFVNEM